MNTKLTLRMEENLIQKAKRYAEKSGKSVSQLVADFFSALGNYSQDDSLSPNVRALKGVLKESSSSKEDYRKHLEDKYL